MMYRIIIDMDDVESAVWLGKKYDVTVRPVSGGSPAPSGNVEIIGDYGSLLAYLIDGISMSDDEAEETIELGEPVGGDEEEKQLSARQAPQGRQFEGFDKFMDRIVLDERKNIVQRESEKSPQRIRAERNQDRPNNRIRYGRVK
jgi:hypothetical protein